VKLPEIPGYGRVHKRTRPDGRVVYVADHRDRNDARRQPTFKTAREAADVLTRAYREWPGRGGSKVSYTMGNMVADYLAHREGEFAKGRTCGGPACRLGEIRPSTIQGDRAAAAAVIAGLGTRQAEDPQARHAIRHWLDSQEAGGDRRSKTPGGGLSTRAVAARASILRRAYLYAIEDVGVVGLQAPPVPRVNVQYRGGGVLIPEVRLQAFRAAVKPHYAEMVEVLIATGARIGEVCGFDLADFDPAKGTLRVRASKTAAGTNRALSLPPYLVEDLVAMVARRYEGRTPDPADPLFTNTRGNRVTDDPFRRRIWDPAAAKAGIPGVKPHSLRHTLATKAAEEGVDPFAMMSHFGWADIRQAKTYVKLARSGVPAIAALSERRTG
jgi:integrase/recombinase XerC